VAVGLVGPYRILEPLGAGAMGVVFLAEDARLSRRVALKTLSGERSRTPEARRKLLREARTAAQLTHPNVAAIYDVVESVDSIHIVMEYVQGETLAARLRRGPLPVEEATAIGIQLADALSKAHSMGVIHRDLKPANVILKPDGQVKVLDFGLATVFASHRDGDDPSTNGSLSQEGRVSGTPGYVAPEAFLGHPRDARSDIYSLGVMLFELVTGRRPFTGQDMIAVGMAALTGPTPRASDLNPRLPPDLSAAIGRAMMREPEQRFASALELAEALRAADVVAAAPTRAVSLAGISIHPPPLRYWMPVAGLLLAASAVGFFAIGRPPPAAATTAVVAVLPLLNATGDPSGADLAAGIADVLISTLGQVPGVTMVSRDATLAHGSRQQPIVWVDR